MIYFIFFCLCLFSNEGSHQSSNGDSNGQQQVQLSRAVTVHPDSAQVMYFAQLENNEYPFFNSITCSYLFYLQCQINSFSCFYLNRSIQCVCVCMCSRVIVSLLVAICRNKKKIIIFFLLCLSSILISCIYFNLYGLLFNGRNRGAIEVLVALYPCPSFLQKNKNKMTTICCSSIYNSAMISSYTHRHTYID